jgi:hypothetical protein
MSTSVLTPGVSQGISQGLSAPAAPPPPEKTRWIISQRDDLMWFVGSALAGYLALALMAVGFPFTLIYFVWFVGVDGPHVIATVTRTYFDKQERKRLGWMLWALLPLMVIGPVMVWLKQASLFYLFAVCWQHYHIAKQHVGFMMLWKAKNKEREPVEAKLDRWFLLISTILPLGLFVIRTRMAAISSVLWIPVGGYALLAAAYVVYQARKWRAGKAMNAPKLMLLGVLVPLQWLAFGYAAKFGADGILRAGIALGLFHSFQYHRLLWFHNKNRYQAPDAQKKHGLAALFAKDFGYYLFAAIGLQALTTVLPQALFPAQWLTATLWGLPFMHYFLDSKIWRVRGDKELAAALRM